MSEVRKLQIYKRSFQNLFKYNKFGEILWDKEISSHNHYQYVSVWKSSGLGIFVVNGWDNYGPMTISKKNEDGNTLWSFPLGNN